MSQFIESICFLDGEPRLLDFHQNRVNQTFSSFFSSNQPYDLSVLIPVIPDDDKYKCRVVYDETTIDVQFIKYHTRPINSLRIIDSVEPLDYKHKKLDRSQLDMLYKQRGQQDDIIILNGGKVSDSYYANLVFFDGEKWVTSNTPLLNGVKRQSLLELGVISEVEISKNDIETFEKVSLINAMLDLEEVVIPIDQVEF